MHVALLAVAMYVLWHWHRFCVFVISKIDHNFCVPAHTSSTQKPFYSI